MNFIQKILIKSVQEGLQSQIKLFGLVRKTASIHRICDIILNVSIVVGNAVRSRKQASHT